MQVLTNRPLFIFIIQIIHASGWLMLETMLIGAFLLYLSVSSDQEISS